MVSQVSGSDTRLIYHHTLDGPIHKVRVEVLGNDAVGKSARLRLCPFFHQGWDQVVTEILEDERIPDPTIAGQERNVFVKADGKEFEYREDNTEDIIENWPKGVKKISIFNRNPGKTDSYDDNPAFNRGLDITFEQDVRLIALDKTGPNKYVTVIADFGEHKKGGKYDFSFYYWNQSDIRK